MPPNIRHQLEDQKADSDIPHVKASSLAHLLVFLLLQNQQPSLGLGLRGGLVSAPLC